MVINSDVVITVGIIIGSSVTIKEDEHIVLEFSLDGSTLPIILSVSSWWKLGDGIRSLVVSDVVRFLYFDTCCLCHSCNSRVINVLKNRIIDYKK